MSILTAGCWPCVPRGARRIAHHLHHVVRHPVRHAVHRIARHPGKIIVAVCCAGTVGPIGGALSAPPSGFPTPAAYAPAPSRGWPETPIYSGGIGGGGAVLIPTYSNARPELLSVQPNVYTQPSITHTTSVPEPSSLALLLLPLIALPVLRRVR